STSGKNGVPPVVKPDASKSVSSRWFFKSGYRRRRRRCCYCWCFSLSISDSGYFGSVPEELEKPGSLLLQEYNLQRNGTETTGSPLTGEGIY
ncbi:unnamed protein product, partial [Brassica rapa subsp. narinosa]